RMVLQFPEDFIHLERGDNGLDEHGRADRAMRYTEFFLRQREDVVPQTRLKVRLQLRQVVVRSAAAPNEFLCVVEEEQSEIEYAGRHRLAIDRDVFFIKMPPAGPGYQDRGFVIEFVL